MRLHDVDFARLYREQMARAGRPERSPEYWDGRAASFGGGSFDSDYVRGFVDRMDLEGCTTLLDVGCGPGTIALTAAPRLDRVYGLDYSPAMLDAFLSQARARGVEERVTAIRLSWDDDWRDVPVCDVVVASRSTALPDIEAPLRKLVGKARRRVYISYPVDGHLVAEEVCTILGRPDRTIPDYLCVVGVIRHLGFHPTLDYLPGENRFARCSNFAEFRGKVADVLGSATPEEETALREYWDANRERIQKQVTKWAMIGWEPGRKS